MTLDFARVIIRNGKTAWTFQDRIETEILLEQTRGLTVANHLYIWQKQSQIAQAINACDNMSDAIRIELQYNDGQLYVENRLDWKSTLGELTALQNRLVHLTELIKRYTGG